MDTTDFHLYGDRIGSLTKDSTGSVHSNAFADLNIFKWEVGIRIQQKIETFDSTDAFDS